MTSTGFINLYISSLLHFQTHAPPGIFQMSKDPEVSPDKPDVLEIEFSKGTWSGAALPSLSSRGCCKHHKGPFNPA